MKSAAVGVLACVCAISGCEYARMLRPNTLKQLNPRVVRLVDYLPEVDAPNKAILGRLFPQGGLSQAKADSSGVFHDEIRVPKNQYIWQPAIIVMSRGGELDLTFYNDDQNLHMAYLPSDGARQIVDLPPRSAGLARVHLEEPGLYWFGCPVADHAGRGMLGLIIVEGDVPVEAKLDRPPQPRP